MACGTTFPSGEEDDPESILTGLRHTSATPRAPSCAGVLPSPAPPPRIVGSARKKTRKSCWQSAGTLCAAAELLKREGAEKIYATVSHFLADEKAFAKLQESCIEELITTNSIPNRIESAKVHQLNIAPLLANAIRRIHDGESVSTLFNPAQHDLFDN